MTNVADSEHKAAAGKIRNLMASYAKNEDLINIGAYVAGSDPVCDKAIGLMDNINDFLKQTTKEKFDYEQTISELLKLASYI